MQVEGRPPLRRASAEGCIAELGWEQSGGEFMPAAAGIVCRLLQRRRAAAKPGLAGRSVDLGGPGQAQDLFQGELMGLAGPGWKKLARMGTCHEYRHTVDEACCWPGALRGRSPRTREGRIGPTARNCSGRWSVVRDYVSPGSELIARWLVLRCDLRHGEVRPSFGMHPFGETVCRPETLRLQCYIRAVTSGYDTTVCPNVMVSEGQIGAYER